MSNKISWSWRHAFAKSELGSTTKLVLHTIGLHMDETGNGCYPTTKQISELSSLSERAVCEHIRKAIEAGWLRSKVHGFRGQKWKNHEYEAHWPTENGDGKGTDMLIPDNAWMESIPHTLPATEKQKSDARKVVGSAISRGSVQKQSCFCCGSKAVEAHHPDYSKPYYVFWLCRLHHKHIHMRDKKATDPHSKIDEKPLTLIQEATDFDDKKLLTEGQSNVPIQHSNNNISANSRFEEFWNVFSHKKGRAEAIKVWKRKKLDKIADQVISGARAYVRARGNDPQYWKHAQGWLNGERWNDFQSTSSQPNDIDWDTRLRNYREFKIWPPDFGPEPGMSGCRAPAALLNNLERMGG